VKAFWIRVGIYVMTLGAMLASMNHFLVAAIQSYPLAVAADNSLTKQTGGFFLEHVPEDHALILGASELNTKMIASHPVNLLKNGRGGVAPNIVGRGSCEAIVHASILAATENLNGKKVVVILSPRSFEPEGISPDMYFANFSELQFCKILSSNQLPDDIKERFKRRMAEISRRYDGDKGGFLPYEMMAKSKLIEVLSWPYLWSKERAAALKDSYDSYRLYAAAAGDPRDPAPIDWQEEQARMFALAQEESGNNHFGFLNDYYAVNIDRKQRAFRNKDAALSYENSVGYDDLTLLLDVCKIKNITPLIISVPLHGPWSDYRGFLRQERGTYYHKVNALIQQYDVALLDLSGKEYEPYYMCDPLHIGWMGWLEINERIVAFFTGDE